ncbi:hypothetical protein [Neisseria sicca]|uniref:hypothetical protein n=1 Tax=Neisseria sicca TaxID=490 RepID=UPI0003180A6A|nr:hypothetical protein [Neisseria sicca]
MFNTERVPVKVYRWDDAGAPQVMPVDGAVKTILKACLVTGYGENENRKEPLGWEMLHENGNDACFRSMSEKSTKWALGVYGGTQYGGADVVGLKDPISAKAGAETVNNNTNKFMYAHYRREDNEPLEWVVVGHARAFCLIITNPNYANICAHLYFGDFPSLAVADNNNCVLSFVTNQKYLDNGSNKISSVVMSDYKGDGFVEVNHAVKSVENVRQVVDYPNPVTNGFTADDIYLFELNQNKKIMLRGLQAGLLSTFERMPNNDGLKYRTVYRNLDNTGDSWMYFRGFNERGFLVNLTAWEI